MRRSHACAMIFALAWCGAVVPASCSDGGRSASSDGAPDAAGLGEVDGRSVDVVDVSVALQWSRESLIGCRVVSTAPFPVTLLNHHNFLHGDSRGLAGMPKLGADGLLRGDDGVDRTFIASGKVFRVTRVPADNVDTSAAGGDHVAYIGMHVKRSREVDGTLVTLHPGVPVEVVLDLSTGYKLRKGETYRVEVETVAEGRVGVVGSAEWLRAEETGAGKLTVRMRSETPLVFTAVETSVEPWVRSAAAAGAPQGPVANSRGLSTGSHVSCDASQTTVTNTAFATATTEIVNPHSYLAAGCMTAAHFTKWFGAYDATRYATVRNTITKVKDFLDNSANTHISNCSPSSCGGAGTIAYVYPSDTSQTVHFCTAFWSLPTTGGNFDSQPGTVVHELSHFTILGGTQDHIYGTGPTQTLATSNPAQAVNNADSIEYFVEQQPPATCCTDSSCSACGAQATCGWCADAAGTCMAGTASGVSGTTSCTTWEHAATDCGTGSTAAQSSGTSSSGGGGGGGSTVVVVVVVVIVVLIVAVAVAVYIARKKKQDKPAAAGDGTRVTVAPAGTAT